MTYILSVHSLTTYNYKLKIPLRTHIPILIPVIKLDNFISGRLNEWKSPITLTLKYRQLVPQCLRSLNASNEAEQKLNADETKDVFMNLTFMALCIMIQSLQK